MSRFAGEPSLEDVLSDPIVQTLMRSDRVDDNDLCRLLEKVGRAKRWPADRRTR